MIDVGRLSADEVVGAARRRNRGPHRYQWTEEGRTILAEQRKERDFRGRDALDDLCSGVIIDGDRGVLPTGRCDSAQITEG